MQNYNFLQVYLHHFILKNQIIKKSLFHLENQLFKNKIEIKYNKHLFILGLPRSGTTILLNFFYKTDEFASLTYNDMPFVLAPNFGSFFPKKKLPKIERKHEDGIKIDNYSPEALDEIFFLTFNDNEIKEYLENFVSLVLKKYSKSRYLSKNNNNYKRLDILQSTFTNSKIFILYRNPLSQAFSLLEQHKKFCKIQKDDKFVLDYMNYLGHNEFGLNYKTWNNSIKYKNYFSLNHWLEQWFYFYKNILKENKYENTFLVSYDDLCKNDHLLNKLCQINGLDYKNDSNFIKKDKHINCEYSNEIINKCNNLFEELNNSKFNIANKSF